MTQIAEMLPVSFLQTLPPADSGRAGSLLKKELQDFHRKIIVLDDDPTGVQTVHGIYVYTDWTAETIMNAFLSEETMFFILTNSRSFSEKTTQQVHTEIASHIAEASLKTGKEYVIISRGDSTLRGHVPLETETLKNTLQQTLKLTFHGEIICPFFLEGGRFTIHNVHYVEEGDFLIPAADTEFAKDRTFGYSASHLGAYMEEKTGGRCKAEDCIYITLEELRALDTSSVYQKLMSASDFQKVIVNAVDYADVMVFCTAWVQAMKMGHHFIARSAAALPKVLGDITSIPLLTGESILTGTSQRDGEKHGGIVIIGSHVKKTSDQLEALMSSPKAIEYLEFHVDSYYAEQGLEPEISRILSQAEAFIRAQKTVVIYTSRALLIPQGATGDETLAVSVSISQALTSIIARLSIKPGFIIAKGGITSSDVGTKGLSVKKALVLGQIKKGIPVWLTGKESKFPDIPYIIFPGNVGDVNTLREIVEELV